MNALIQWIIIFSILGLCLITLIIFSIVMEIKWKKLDKEIEKLKNAE